MAPPKTPPTDPKVPTVIAPDAAMPAPVLDDRAPLEERLRLAEQERDRLRSQLDAREDRAPAPAVEEARLPRIVGSIPVYDTDTPADVHRRAADVRAGKIPADRASKFKVDANIYIRGEGLKTKFRGAASIPLGAIVDRADFSDEDRAEYITAGALIPVG